VLNGALYPPAEHGGRSLEASEILGGEEVGPWEGASALYAELSYVLDGGENLRKSSTGSRCARQHAVATVLMGSWSAG
jgi:hypothetical protein